MADAPLISIIIAVLDAEHELRTTLESIAAQRGTLESIEVLIVDGGSEDGTLDVARRSPVVDSVVSEPDDGIYDAMNKGAARASGRWLHFLNAGDSFIGPEALRSVQAGIARAETTGKSWFIAGAEYTGDHLAGTRIANLPHVWYRHALGLQPHCHQAIWFRADLFAAMGGYDLAADFVADFDLIMRWGLVSAPETDPTVLIGYLSGGISERREAQIPGLIRAVRIRRMELDPVPVPVERLLVTGVRVLTKLSRLRTGRRVAAGG